MRSPHRVLPAGGLGRAAPGVHRGARYGLLGLYGVARRARGMTGETPRISSMRICDSGPSLSDVAMMRLVIISISASTSVSWTLTSSWSFTLRLPRIGCRLADPLEAPRLLSGPTDVFEPICRNAISGVKTRDCSGSSTGVQRNSPDWLVTLVYPWPIRTMESSSTHRRARRSAAVADHRGEGRDHQSDDAHRDRGWRREEADDEPREHDERQARPHQHEVQPLAWHQVDRRGRRDRPDATASEAVYCALTYCALTVAKPKL